MSKKESKIKVSVLIPVCNVAKYLPKCLESVINQSLEEIEIICINDGSTDNSLEILTNYGEKDKRIKVIDKKHTGYGHSLNEGLKIATGQYISIIEADDVVSTKMLQTLYELTENGTIDLVKGNYFDYYSNEESAPTYRKNGDHDFLKDGEISIRKYPELIAAPSSIYSSIYRRNFLDKKNIRFSSEDLSDILFGFDTLIHADKAVWTSEPLYYALRNNEQSMTNMRKDASVFLNRMNEVLVLLKDNHLDEREIMIHFTRSILNYLKLILSTFDHDTHYNELCTAAQNILMQLDEDMVKSEFDFEHQKIYYKFCTPLQAIKAKSPKILIYNWLPFDNQWKWGGGVTVYCYNIISEFLKERPDVDIYFLSSGFAYNSNTIKTFTRKISNVFGERVHQFEIVNSPVPAEQRNLYVNPLVALENSTLKEVFKQFIEDYGPFDAIHFNNIEGLSLDVLDLKEFYPDTKFIFSIHNYVPLCVNGSYYMRHKHCNCNPNHTGEDCFKCTRMDIRSNLAVETYRRGLYGLKPEECISQGRWIKHFKFDRLDIDVSTKDILKFAETATKKLNKNCDHILAVSKRVYEIAADNGFDESKMSVDYIGTVVAAKQIGHAISTAKDGLKIVFLGSDINFEEKGYAFLLDALSQLDKKYASKIDLLLTVKSPEHAEIKKMCQNFRSLKIVQGYTHDDLKWIFEGAHLSIVPVLWEDNLPQIAIESVANGVPVLASTAGGAKELCDSNLFTFECGNIEDLNQKLMHFVDNPTDLQQYWNHHHGLVTMSMHLAKLQMYYGIDKADKFELSESDFISILKEHYFLSDLASNQKISFVPNSKLEELQSQLHNAYKTVNELQEKLKIAISEKEQYEMREQAKVIFQTEYDSVLGEAGAYLFKIVLEDFIYSDFYAEIKFVNIANIAASASDTLKVSGTLLENDGERAIKIHQFEWEKNDQTIRNNISVFTKGNEVYFFGLHNGKASGYLYQLITLTSRADHDSLKFVRMNEGFLFENELLPNEGFRRL